MQVTKEKVIERYGSIAYIGSLFYQFSCKRITERKGIRNEVFYKVERFGPSKEESYFYAWKMQEEVKWLKPFSGNIVPKSMKR